MAVAEGDLRILAVGNDHESRPGRVAGKSDTGRSDRPATPPQRGRCLLEGGRLPAGVRVSRYLPASVRPRLREELGPTPHGLRLPESLAPGAAASRVQLGPYAHHSSSKPPRAHEVVRSRGLTPQMVTAGRGRPTEARPLPRGAILRRRHDAECPEAGGIGLGPPAERA